MTAMVHCLIYSFEKAMVIINFYSMICDTSNHYMLYVGLIVTYNNYVLYILINVYMVRMSLCARVLLQVVI